MSTNAARDTAWFLPHAGLQRLIDVLCERGYTVVAPKLSQGAVVYEATTDAATIPFGWIDAQEPGRYRVIEDAEAGYFGYTVGPHSWKQFLFPPRAVVATSVRTEDGWNVSSPADDGVSYAFLGVRACEIAAIEVQDRVFLQQAYVDPIYAARRERAFIVAVNCTRAASTCFCVSMRTGPRCHHGFDLALTELPDGFVLEAATDRGHEIAAQLPLPVIADAQLATAERLRQRAADQQTRSLPLDGLHDLMLSQLQHPRWSEVAERCLSCTNCTQVCPTCFCSSVQEVTDLDAANVDRVRTWDSCFNFDFSYMNGGVVRNTIRSRYRQWLTHKLGTWFDQFDTCGCVGCGRCITWCPVGIDLTEEVAALQSESTP
jgi:sulfhydrogenase subunit beta (sulfur reductase)